MSKPKYPDHKEYFDDVDAVARQLREAADAAEKLAESELYHGYGSPGEASYWRRSSNKMRRQEMKRILREFVSARWPLYPDREVEDIVDSTMNQATLDDALYGIFERLAMRFEAEAAHVQASEVERIARAMAGRHFSHRLLNPKGRLRLRLDCFRWNGAQQVDYYVMESVEALARFACRVLDSDEIGLPLAVREAAKGGDDKLARKHTVSFGPIVAFRPYKMGVTDIYLASQEDAEKLAEAIHPSDDREAEHHAWGESIAPHYERCKVCPAVRRKKRYAYSEHSLAALFIQQLKQVCPRKEQPRARFGGFAVDSCPEERRAERRVKQSDRDALWSVPSDAPEPKLPGRKPLQQVKLQQTEA